MNTSFASKGFQDRAKRILGSQGNVPGFPNQFRKEGEGDNAPNANKEFINIALDTPANIKQTRYQRSMLGRYESLPEDLPFDYKQEQRKNHYLAMLGFGVILVGAFYFK